MSRLLQIALLTFALLTPIANAQSIHDISDDGAWCWFADPRAIVVGDHLLAGWVNSKGDIVVSDQVRGTDAKLTVMHAGFEKDDHANPALLSLPDGRVLVFYSKHSGRQMMVRASGVNDFATWTAERGLSLNDPDFTRDSNNRSWYTYPNPNYLADEKTIVMTWRGMNWKPTISFSRDLGETWTSGKIIFSEHEGRKSNRPYVKVVSDGKKRVHFIATDGHPRNEATNSVYHFYYESGAFYRMDGTQIATLETLPVRPEDCDVVYDGKSEAVRSWVWDLALDSEGYPVAVYSRLPAENKHEYRYVRWNGFRWIDRKITDAGGWFPETPDGKTEPEPHYSGGVVLDHNAPSYVYLSREIAGTHQIEEWMTADRGESWTTRQLTDSIENNVRPVVARGLWTGGTALFWMKNRKYIHYLNYDSMIQSLIFRDRPVPGPRPATFGRYNRP